jgi:hypothetical protein
MAMSSGRPGGLLTMAIMNFIFGGWGMLSLIGVAMLLFMKDHPAHGQFSTSTLITMGCFTLINSILLMVSGIGYLGQKWKLGFLVGLLYGLFGIVAEIIEIILLEQEVAVGQVIGLLYPAETLFFLLVVFRRDFGARD